MISNENVDFAKHEPARVELQFSIICLTSLDYTVPTQSHFFTEGNFMELGPFLFDR